MTDLPSYAKKVEPFGPTGTEGIVFISPMFEKALSHWEKLKGDQAFPLWSDANLLNSAQFSPYVSVAEILENDYCFQYVGAEVSKNYGERNGDLLSEIDPHLGSRIKDFFDSCCRTGRPSYVYWPLSANQRHVDAEALCLPFSDNGSSLDVVVSLSINSLRM